MSVDPWNDKKKVRQRTEYKEVMKEVWYSWIKLNNYVSVFSIRDDSYYTIACYSTPFTKYWKRNWNFYSYLLKNLFCQTNGGHTIKNLFVPSQLCKH